jgi:hypothetical protein
VVVQSDNATEPYPEFLTLEQPVHLAEQLRHRCAALRHAAELLADQPRQRRAAALQARKVPGWRHWPEQCKTAHAFL